MELSSNPKNPALWVAVPTPVLYSKEIPLSVFVSTAWVMINWVDVVIPEFVDPSIVIIFVEESTAVTVVSPLLGKDALPDTMSFVLIPTTESS